MGIGKDALASYLIALYCSTAVLTDAPSPFWKTWT